mmetsp:Transcript_14443/g.18345  ORF Transcript_14443/g.18345 Transcript_14443/m.18345 type:complete len:101 (+) Transcript_14443:830-1132(+)
MASAIKFPDVVSLRLTSADRVSNGTMTEPPPPPPPAKLKSLQEKQTRSTSSPPDINYKGSKEITARQQNLYEDYIFHVLKSFVVKNETKAIHMWGCSWQL